MWVRSACSPRNATANAMIRMGWSELIRVTSSRRVRPNAANAVAAPETKNAPAPKNNATHRSTDVSGGRHDTLPARRERTATITASGGNANHSRQVVKTTASE